MRFLTTLVAIVLMSTAFCCVASAGMYPQQKSSIDPPCPAYPEPVALSPATLEAGMSSALAKVDSLIARIVAQYALPGVIVGIAYDQDIFWSKGYGRRDPFNATSPPPDLDSVLRIASITKTFTAALMFVLRDAGTINLDDPIEKYLPEFKVQSTFPSRRPLTLREVASHTAGLQRESPCLPLDDCGNKTVPQVLIDVAKTWQILPQYARFHYSNLGTALLGHGLASAAKSAFEPLLHRQVLAPLGITHARFTCCDAYQQAHLAVGVANGQPASLPDLVWGNPDGGLIASARDVLKFATNLQRDRVQGPGQLLDSSTVYEFLKPTVLLRDGMSAVGTPWEMRYLGRYWTVSKAGGLSGYRTQVAMIPDLKLSLFIGVQQSNVADDYVWTMPVLSALVDGLEPLLWANQPAYVLPDSYQDVEGNYTIAQAPSMGTASVYVNKDGVMMLEFSGNPTMNLTFVQTVKDVDMWKAQIVDPQTGCRWLDDGTEGEWVYFQREDRNTAATAFTFMSDFFSRVSA